MKKYLLLIAIIFSSVTTAGEVCLIAVTPDLLISNVSCSFDVENKFENKYQNRPASDLIKRLIGISFALKNVVQNNTSNITIYTFTRRF